MQQNPLQVLFEDEYYIAINKPYALLVHRTKISEDKVFALQLLRNQIGQHIYPVHRLDRPTSGVLIFGKSSEAAQKLSLLFTERSINKEYLAIVRGFVKPTQTINYALKNEENGKVQEAVTNYECMAQNELPFAIGYRYKTARFSYVNVKPITGRSHQIRRHFSHLRHPIIGDVRHGDVKQNKYFKNKLGIERMFLHARKLSFVHPFNNESVEINADLEEQFTSALKLLFNI